MLSFIPKPFTLPGPLTFTRGLEEPLVFEDLSKSGYKMWKSGLDGLGLAHTESAIEAFGKFHALGLILFEREVLDDENMRKVLEARNTWNDSVMTFVDKGVELLRSWMLNNDYDKIAINSLEAQHKCCIESFDSLLEDGKNHELQVVLHGDGHPKNMMFKYDGQIPAICKLLDFQQANIFPPFYDLVLFFAVSVPSEILKLNYQSIINRLIFSSKIVLRNMC